VTAGAAQMFTAYLPEAALQLTAIERGIFAHKSGREHNLIAECGRNGPACVQQRFQMRFGSLLKP